MKKTVCDHDVDEAIEGWPVRPYSKSELARAYAPEIGERSGLLTAFRAGYAGTWFCIRLCWIRVIVAPSKFSLVNRWNSFLGI